MTLLVLCFLIGCIAGLRALTAPAVVCWGARLGWLNLEGTKLGFLGSPWAVGIFTLLALLEIGNDKNPKTPARTAPGGLIPRIITGALSGAAVALSAGGSWVLGAVLGIVGAVAGAFGGYHVRHYLTTQVKLPDLPVALVEDLVAIGCGLLIVAHVM
jgi:uncharacterized membrane protein